MILALMAMMSLDRPTLWIIGDSTVHNNTAGQQGWGEPIASHFNLELIEVKNRAIGGRSSRTFQTDGRWDAILQESKPGDFVLIQFGHNDPGAINDDSRARGTIRGIGEETESIDNLLTKKPEVVHTFGWYLRKYLDDAKSHGITPILLSYVPRCPRPGEVIAPDPEPTSYRLWARQVAETAHVPFVDLFGLIWRDYAKMTPETIKAQYFSAADFTHTNPAGAEFNAKKVVEGLRLLPEAPLTKYLK